MTVQAVDGRSARSQRTRDAVVEALITLLEEGHIQPTTTAIAARAGVAERTIFQHFPERDSLFNAVAARQAERRATLPVPTSGALDERLDAFCRQRAQVLELGTPVRRGALLREPFSDAVAESLSGFRALKRQEAARVFATELRHMPGAKREVTTAALGAAASWSAWEELRRHQGLSVDRARAAMRRALTALLTA